MTSAFDTVDKVLASVRNVLTERIIDETQLEAGGLVAAIMPWVNLRGRDSGAE